MRARFIGGRRAPRGLRERELRRRSARADRVGAFGHEKGAFTGAKHAERGVSSSPTAARCFSTRSASCRSSCRRSCSTSSRSADSGASAARASFSRRARHRATNRDLQATVATGTSAATSSTASTSSPSWCRRCASGRGRPAACRVLHRPLRASRPTIRGVDERTRRLLVPVAGERARAAQRGRAFGDPLRHRRTHCRREMAVSRARGRPPCFAGTVAAHEKAIIEEALWASVGGCLGPGRGGPTWDSALDTRGENPCIEESTRAAFGRNPH